MYLFEEYNIASLHIPKNAGSSLRFYFVDLFGKYKIIGPEHALLKNKIHHLPKDCKIVATVRNPYDRVVSMYYHRRGNYSPNNTGSWKNLLRNAGTMDFKNWFIKTILPSLNSHIPEDQPTYLSILIEDKIPENVFIAKTETLKEDVDRILVELNIFSDKEFSRANVTAARPSKDWEHLYDDELKQLVYGWDKWTFDNFYIEYKP